MTALQIKLGEYHHEPTLAPYIELFDSWNQSVLEFHDRKFAEQACEHDWELREFHTLLREQAIIDGFLFDLGDGRYVRRKLEEQN